jgi:hypothetical protein
MKKSGPIEAIRNTGTHKAGSLSGDGDMARGRSASHNAASRTGRVDADLLARPQPREPVGIGIAAEQQQLVDQHRAVPDRRARRRPGAAPSARSSAG